MEGVRADRMSVYGHARPTALRAEALALDGAVFERAYTSSPDAAFAVASLLTGKYPPEHGMLAGGVLGPDHDTLAETLQAAGYATRVVSSEPALTRESGVLQGFEGVDEVDPVDVPELDGGAAEVTRRALAWLDRGWDGKRPFFLMAVYSSPLLPFSPPEEYRRKYLRPADDPNLVEMMSEVWLPFAERYTSRRMEFGAPELSVLRDLYDAEVLYADEQWGAVVAALRSRRLAEKTLVVLTATRGEDLGGNHRLADRSSLREANLRVPLIMALPGRIPKGIKVGGLAQDVDVFPTVCELLGVPLPPTVGPGAVSLASMGGPPRRDRAVSVAIVTEPSGLGYPILGMREGDHRVVVGPHGVISLYHLAADAAEIMNLAGASGEVAARMVTKLQEWDAALRLPAGLAGPTGSPGAAAAAPAPGPATSPAPAGRAAPPAAGPQPPSRP
jgi:arylsulfatase A-like enzyme